MYTVDLRQHDIHTRSHDDWFRPSSNIKGITLTIWEAIVSVLLMRKIYDECHWDGLSGMTYIHTEFMKICTGVQAILRSRLRNMRGFNDGITDRRFFTSAPLRWTQVRWYTYQVSWILVQAFKQHWGFAPAIWKAVMLVLLMGGIYDVCCSNGLRWHDIHTKFHVDWYRRSSSIKVLPQQFEGL
jgi:hypothetical protein